MHQLGQLANNMLNNRHKKVLQLQESPVLSLYWSCVINEAFRPGHMQTNAKLTNSYQPEFVPVSCNYPLSFSHFKIAFNLLADKHYRHGRVNSVTHVMLVTHLTTYTRELRKTKCIFIHCLALCVYHQFIVPSLCISQSPG